MLFRTRVERDPARVAIRYACEVPCLYLADHTLSAKLRSENKP